MATRKPKTDAQADDIAATQQPTQAAARALVDLPDHGVACGHLLQADASTVAALAAAGLADPHPDAVAYAQALAA